MIKSFITALLLTLSFASFAARAQGLCTNLFSGAEHFESNHLKQVKTSQSVLGHDVFLVARKNIEKKRLLLKPKIEIAEWFDFRNNLDRPGDIRWGAEFLPSGLKEVLGLKTWDHSGQASAPMSHETSLVQLPTVKTVSAIYSSLENRMQQQDPNYRILNFYEAKDHAISGREYLTRFAHESLLPFSTQGHLYEHDLNFHAYSSLVLPGYVSKALRLRAEAFLDLVSYMETRSVHSKNTELKKSLEKYIFRKFVERIDTSKGNLFAAMMLLKNESISALMTEVDVFLQVSFVGQTSPQKYLNTLLERENMGPGLHEVLNEYWSQAPAKFKQDDLSQAFVHNPAEFYNDAQANLKALNQAAENLLKK